MSRTYRRVGLFHHLTHDTYPHTKEQFHRDSGNMWYVNYSGGGSWGFSNIRNRQLRRVHKNEIYKCLCTYNEHNVILSPFIHNSGWDEY